MSSKSHPDYRLLAAFTILFLFGLIMLASASAVVGFERFGDSYYFLKRQLGAAVIGIVLFIVFYRLDYRRWQRLAVPLLLATFILLLMVFVRDIGQSYGTFARRWVRLGPITLQPSELAKLSIIIYLAAWFSNRSKRLGDFKFTFLPFAFILAIIVGLVIWQPDIGTAFIISLIAGGVYFLAGGRFAYLAILIAAGLVTFLLLLQFRPHAADRFKIYLHPELDPQGIGYHINQASLAIGSGGLLGRGFGQSRAKFQYLPEVYGDSIFAVIAEELGFVAAAAVLLLLFYLLYRGLKIAVRAPDDFGRLLAGGIVLWLTGQALINISAIVGLLPLTGIPLPFISYGSSSLVTSLAAVGILANISTHQRDV